LPVGALSTLTLRGEASWTDTIYNDIFNGAAPLQEATTQPSYWLVNARLGWDYDHGRYRVQLFGENLTNTLYTNARASFASAPFVTVGGNLAAPRTFGLRVSIKR
jgi:outer membrane receptor for ferric coprogen and ferric-rhodotorulic acid